MNQWVILPTYKWGILGLYLLTIDPNLLGHPSGGLFGDGLDGSLFRGLGEVGMKHLNIYETTPIVYERVLYWDY